MNEIITQDDCPHTSISLEQDGFGWRICCTDCGKTILISALQLMRPDEDIEGILLIALGANAANAWRRIHPRREHLRRIE